MFRTHLIHQPFASYATSYTMQQLLLRYQIPQYDRHHFPVTGILLISKIYVKTKELGPVGGAHARNLCM